MTIFRIWIISCLIVLGTVLGIMIYEDSGFISLIVGPLIILISVVFLGLVAWLLSVLRSNFRLAGIILFGLAAVFSGYCLWSESSEAYLRSDPTNDFKRFVMGGPHWPDEDKTSGYDPNVARLPDSVRVIRSKTFENFDAEGAVILFQTDKADLERIIAANHFESSVNPNDLKKLNTWSKWYLWASSCDLGTSPSWYLVNYPSDPVETRLMTVNGEHSRAIFLYLNVN